MHPFKLEISLGDNSKVVAMHKGTVHLLILVNGKERIWTLHNVLLVSGLAYNLLSISKLTDNEMYILFEDDGCDMVNKQTGELVV
jgi:hypothetical protein